jgi:hypothetical protein
MKQKKSNIRQAVVELAIAVWTDRNGVDEKMNSFFSKTENYVRALGVCSTAIDHETEVMKCLHIEYIQGQEK